MVGLSPGKKSYRYRVGGFDPVNSTTRHSQEFTFQSPPTVDANQKTVFAMLGDQVSSRTCPTTSVQYVVRVMYAPSGIVGTVRREHSCC